MCTIDMSVFGICYEQVDNMWLLCSYSKYFCPKSVGGMPEIERGAVNLKQ
jgi:hypothetical protein